MLLREIKIQNFRSLKDVSILLNKETVLIGENNSGKTSVLDAIRFALSKTSSYRNSFDEYDYYMDKKVLSPQESEGISIILRFEESNENEWPDEVIHQMGEVLQVIDNDSRYSVIIRVSSVFNKATGDYEYKTVFLNFKNEELKTNQNKVNAFFKYRRFESRLVVSFKRQYQCMKNAGRHVRSSGVFYCHMVGTSRFGRRYRSVGSRHLLTLEENSDIIKRNIFVSEEDGKEACRL